MPTPTPNIFKAIAAIQNAFVIVKKNENATLRSKYADEADVRRELDPKLKEHGLGISFSPGRLNETGDKWKWELALTVFHIESGEVIRETGEFPLPEGNRGVSFAQTGGSGLSYAKRNFLVAFFGIITGDDDDAKRAREALIERDAPGQVSDTAHWKLLMDGHWADAPAPGAAGCTLGELTPQERAALAKKFPDDVGLTAWIAERLEGSMQELGYDWPAFCEAAGGSWPETMELCGPAQIRAAATAAKSLKSSR